MGPDGRVESTGEKPRWTSRLDTREYQQVAHALSYRDRFQTAGIPGHGLHILIAKLADILDELDSLGEVRGGVKVVWDKGGECWRDAHTGVRVTFDV